jgi:hypothetical protein
MAAAGFPIEVSSAVFDEAAIANAPADWAVGEALPLESAAAVAFVADFKFSVAAALAGVEPTDVAVTSITKGSVVVAFVITSSTASAADLSAAADAADITVNVGLGRIVALYYTHPLNTRITSIVGTSFSEATMRPNPR